MKKTIVLLLGLVTIALPLPGCTESLNTNTFTTTPLVTTPPVTDTIAPDFSLEDLEGNTVTLSEMIGKKVILNFWSIT